MPGGHVFLPHQFDSSRGIIGDEVPAYRPAEVPFQTDQRAVHGGRLLSLGCLKIRAVVGERWCRDGVEIKITTLLGSSCTSSFSSLVPRRKVANITKVIAHRSRCEILLLT